MRAAFCLCLALLCPTSSIVVFCFPLVFLMFLPCIVALGLFVCVCVLGLRGHCVLVYVNWVIFFRGFGFLSVFLGQFFFNAFLASFVSVCM